jgi:hypothetical protein
MALLFSPAVHFFAGQIDVEAADTGSAVGDALATGFGALGAVLAALFLAAVALLTLVAVMPMATMALALGVAGYERTWLAVLFVLPLAGVGYLGIGQLLPGSAPWWFWPAIVALAAPVSVCLADVVPARRERAVRRDGG